MTKRLTLLLVLLASPLWAQSTSRGWFPAPHPTGNASSSFPAIETMVCAAWVPTEGITGVTTMTWYLTGGLGGGGLCTLVLYDAAGAAQIAHSAPPSDCSATGVVSAASSVVFSLAAGTKVQVCLCGNAAGSYLGADPGPGSAIQLFQNAITAAPFVTNATNPCVAAAPPASTGVLTGVNANAPIGELGTGAP